MAYGIAGKILLARLAERAILTLHDPADTGGEVRDALEVRAELRGRIAYECAAEEVVAPGIPEQGSRDGQRDREPDAAVMSYKRAWIDIQASRRCLAAPRSRCDGVSPDVVRRLPARIVPGLLTDLPSQEPVSGW
jgi:hypothetical protein